MPRLLRTCLASLTLFVAVHATPVFAAERPTAGSERAWIVASGVSEARLELALAAWHRLAEEFEATSRVTTTSDLRSRAEAIHDFLHRRALRGKYRADASNLAEALEGGAFNCVAATALYLSLAERAGLKACAVAAPGHVWCRVHEGRQTIEIETTCRDWFAVAARYRGVADEYVSPAMAAHRRRVREGRELAPRELLAICRLTRGGTFLREDRFDAAIAANLQALALDPLCRPARENLAAVVRHLAGQAELTAERNRLLLKILAQAWDASVVAGRAG